MIWSTYILQFSFIVHSPAISQLWCAALIKFFLVWRTPASEYPGINLPEASMHTTLNISKLLQQRFCLHACRYMHMFKQRPQCHDSNVPPWAVHPLSAALAWLKICISRLGWSLIMIACHFSSGKVVYTCTHVWYIHVCGPTGICVNFVIQHKRTSHRASLTRPHISMPYLHHTCRSDPVSSRSPCIIKNSWDKCTPANHMVKALGRCHEIKIQSLCVMKKIADPQARTLLSM